MSGQWGPNRVPSRGRGSRFIGLGLLVTVVAVGVVWFTIAGGLAAIAPASGTPTTGSAIRSPDAAPQVEPSGAGSPDPSLMPPSADPSSRGQPPLDPMFGMSGHLMWHDVPRAIAQLDMLRDDGLGVVRFDVAWRGLEPERGRYAFLDKLDPIVDAAVERGIRLVISVAETPRWANGGASAWDPPDDPADYAAFVGMLAGRYAGRVEAWEVWNEPNIKLFWRPNPEPVRYARLLIAAAAAIRAANPAATVVGGSIAFGDVDFVRALYANGARGSFDALSVHPYTLKQAPDDESDRYTSLTATLDDMHQVMADAGDGDTPIWITELGWAVVGLNSVSAAKRPGHLARSVELIVQRPWVEVVTVYTIDTLDSERYGLSTGGRRSAAWRAYVEAVQSRTR